MTEEYKRALHIAYHIYAMLAGEPKTHHEWVTKFNVCGDIAKLIERKRIDIII